MEKYKINKRISEGAFGVVYEAEKPNQKGQTQYFAVKQIYSNKTTDRQINILESLPPHQNIMHVYEIVERNKFQKSIVMERGKYDLATLIDSFQYPINQSLIKNVAVGALRALKHLHQNKIIHRDLKPSNILVKENGKEIILCDFGSAVRCSQGENYQLEGFTRWYKCPQMLFGSRNYQYEVDIWSLGCILMELACGEPLFPGKSELQQLSLIGNILGEPSPQNWPSITKLHDYGKIHFAKKPVKSMKQISDERCIGFQLCQFVMRMIRYEGRSTVDELLADPYLKETPDIEYELGIFGLKKFKSKLFN